MEGFGKAAASEFLGCTATFEWKKQVGGPTIAHYDDMNFVDTSPTVPMELWDWMDDLVAENMHP